MKKFKSIFTLKRIIKFILIIIVLFATRTGYQSVSQALSQNYQENNSTIDKKLPPLVKKQKQLATGLKNAKHDKIVTEYHYKQVFSNPNSKDKTLKKWINKRQTVDDRIDDLNTKIKANNQKVSHYQNAYISKANINNAAFNLTSIALVVAVVAIFFVLSF
ncbi:hypothetical protein MOO44_00060 (plasmid) [Nicoliella spurrieriana]|uniref:Uncharacterized protein n=2 Tax=Nicoliella spurrieriana TaxID=2925830 RepID=A0A976RQN9_9LACO|nr:hypothetical protein MOO44_00060 [Nicoliella spurrieriana]